MIPERVEFEDITGNIFDAQIVEVNGHPYFSTDTARIRDVYRIETGCLVDMFAYE